MKIVLILFLCFILNLNAFGQSGAAEIASDTAIEGIYLARDDGKGNPGEITDKFATTDTPIYCLIKLNSIEPATIKMILVAVKAVGLPPETKSISVSYTTKQNENGVNFNAAPDKDWSAGAYRFDIYVNDKFAKSLAFEIVKSPAPTDADKPAAAKNFVPVKKPNKSRKN